MGQASSSPSPSPSNTVPLLLHSEKSHSFRDIQFNVEPDLTVDFPEECMAWIFQRLSSKDRNTCSLVCKRWHFVEAKSRDRLTLKTDANVEPHVVPIMSRYEFITCLSLKCNRKEISIDDNTFLLIGQHCKQLSRLKLKSCKAISDDGLGEFSKVCGPLLKKFSCGSCGFGSKGLNLLLQNCPKLEDLSVKRLRKLRDNPEDILPGKSQLRCLCLKELMSAYLFETLIAGSKHMHTLVLARNPGLGDQFFKVICEHLSELVELHVETLNMGDMALKAIANCSKLEVLHVAKVSDCSDTGFSAIANGCQGLRKLYIDDRRISPIGDEGLIAMGKHCTKMQELVLIGVNVTTKSLALIASNCTGLERMALCSSDAVGDGELSCIADKCMSLKKLCIKNCPISDVGMEGLVRGCPNLSKVKVKRCKDITMASAVRLQMNRPSLVVSLDTPAEVTPEDEELVESPQGGDAARATFFRNRTPLAKSRLVLAASNFLRRFPKPS